MYLLFTVIALGLATHDIAVDGLAIDILKYESRAFGSSA